MKWWHCCAAPDPLSPAVLSQASSLHVQYLLLPWTWGGLSKADLYSYEAASPGSVVFDNPAMVIVKVPSPSTTGGIGTARRS